MAIARAPTSLLLLLVLVLQWPMMMTPCSSSEPPSLSCRLDYTSLALLSCQETPPESPTRSCCEALLYAVDDWPVSDRDKGVCCLCVYVVIKGPEFDLAGAYVACGGKDAAAVEAWKATPALDCNGPCQLGGPPPPPPPPPSRGGARIQA